MLSAIVFVVIFPLRDGTNPTAVRSVQVHFHTCRFLHTSSWDVTEKFHSEASLHGDTDELNSNIFDAIQPLVYATPTTKVSHSGTFETMSQSETFP